MLSIIIPVLNEAAGLVGALGALVPLRHDDVDIVVVDGGSSDATVERARPFADQLIVAPRGRASQMNAGAAIARGDTLLFLHVDTRLPEEGAALALASLQSGHAWGRFDVRIEGTSAWLPMVATMMNWRSRITGMATGDQALFVRKDVFVALGGFPDIPLMEDIALSAKLRRLSPPARPAARVRTSGRRWEAKGVWRTILLMWRLRWRYWLGADPRQLAKEYGYAPRES